MCNVILGAGLTGLSAGYALHNEKVQHLILEKSTQPGGINLSFKIENTIFDTGVHIFYFQNNTIKQLFASLLENSFFRQEKNVKIYIDGRLINYPYQANLYQLPLKRKLLSIIGLLRRPKQPNGTSNLKQWLLTKYGKTIAEDFLIPHNNKLMCISLTEISEKWANRFFPSPNLSDIILGSLRCNRRQFHPNQYFMYPIHDGAGKICQILSRNLEISYGVRVVNINTDTKLITMNGGLQIRYDKLLSTIPLPELLYALQPRPDWAEEIIARLKFSSIVLLMLRCNGRSDLSRKGIHWIYFPDPSVPFQRISFTENFSRYNAPQDETGICIECTFSPNMAYPNEIVEQCIKYLEEIGIVCKESILEITKYVVDYGYPLYHHRYDTDLKKVREYLNNYGILTTGRFGSWEYSNMEDAIIWGFDGAKWMINGSNKQ